jgi:hypothetical protein
MSHPKPKGELNHALHPRLTIYRWIAFYVLLAAVLFVIFDAVTSQFRTYRVPTGSVELSVPYITYLQGEPITFSLKNNYDSPIYMPNNCPEEPLSVFKFDGSKWVRLHSQANPDFCFLKDRQIKIAPHSIQNGNFAAWPDLFKAPGRYRLVAYVDYFNTASYQDFEVIARPEKQKVYVQMPGSQTSSQGSAQTSPSRSAESSNPVKQPSLTPYSVTTSAGSITVEYSSAYIYVRSVKPSASCGYEGGRSGTFVETTFKCPGGETQVQLWMSGGRIQQKIE